MGGKMELSYMCCAWNSKCIANMCAFQLPYSANNNYYTIYHHHWKEPNTMKSLQFINSQARDFPIKFEHTHIRYGIFERISKKKKNKSYDIAYVCVFAIVWTGVDLFIK